MRLWKKIVMGMVVAVFGAPIAISYGAAWYERIEAERLLACAKTLQPGITTEAEFHKALQPIVGRLQDHHSQGGIEPDGSTDDFQVFNGVSWTPVLFERIGELSNDFVGHSPLPEWGMFEVSAGFKEGELVKLRVIEFNLGGGVGHPFADIVEIYAHQAPVDDVDGWVDAGPFSGYAVHTTMLQDFMGKQLRTPVPFKQLVYVDERATAKERRKALDFNFQCFTAIGGCRDASLMLQPSPNR